MGAPRRFHGPSRQPRAVAGGRRTHAELGDRARRGQQLVCRAQPGGGRGDTDEAGEPSREWPGPQVGDGP